MKPAPLFHRLSNTDLAAAVLRYAQDERDVTALFIESLAEFDRRRLYLDLGFNSLFAYCLEALKLSEHAAYARIEGARAVRRFPAILQPLRDGTLTLTNLCLVSRHLTAANHTTLLEQVAGKRKEDVQRILARMCPAPDVASAVRKLPARAVTQVSVGEAAPLASPSAASLTASLTASSAATSTAPATAQTTAPAMVAARASRQVPAPPTPAVLAPLAPERYKLQITIDEETREVLRQAQDLMRHANPSGDPAVIVARALRVLVDDLLKKKASLTEHPRPSHPPVDGSRTIPAAVQREVWTRDEGRCVFEGPRGRCPERGFLEFHHVIPYGLGGEATANNIELRCRAHNSYQANLDGLGWRRAASNRPQSSG